MFTTLEGISEQWLLERYRSHNDQAAREELIRRMAPLVRHVASSYRAAGHEDDLLQVAWLGLVKAIDRYDPSYGHALRSYAIPTMYGEVRRYLRDHSWGVRPPRPLQERVLAITRTVNRLTARAGRAPTPQQVADELGLELEDVLEGLQAGSSYATISLDAPVGRDEGPDLTVGDTIGYRDERLQLAEEIASLRGLAAELDDRDRTVLHLRFVRDMTQTEIAAEVGCSQMQVSRILRRVLLRLHERVRDDAVPATPVG